MIRFDNLYINIAYLISKESKAERLKVGCVIVRDDRIISYGYNGTPSGMDNTCEKNNVTVPEVVHAEVNAVIKLAKSTESIQGCIVYVTHSPCVECSKLLAHSGISELVYHNEYRITDGIELLKKMGIKVRQWNG